MENLKKIYGTETCHKCLKLKDKYPDVEYVDINFMVREDRERIISDAISKGIQALPIVIDEDGNIILHKNLGI